MFRFLRGDDGIRFGFGFGGIFRESLVSRSPETLSFDIELPADPVLDMAVGTLESGEVSFEVSNPFSNGPSPGTEPASTTEPPPTTQN